MGVASPDYIHILLFKFLYVKVCYTVHVVIAHWVNLALKCTIRNSFFKCTSIRTTNPFFYTAGSIGWSWGCHAHPTGHSHPFCHAHCPAHLCPPLLSHAGHMLTSPVGGTGEWSQPTVAEVGVEGGQELSRSVVLDPVQCDRHRPLHGRAGTCGLCQVLSDGRRTQLSPCRNRNSVAHCTSFIYQCARDCLLLSFLFQVHDSVSWAKA